MLRNTIVMYLDWRSQGMPSRAASTTTRARLGDGGRATAEGCAPAAAAGGVSSSRRRFRVVRPPLGASLPSALFAPPVYGADDVA